MIFRLSATLLAGCILITTPAHAHDLKPGLYKVDVQVELPNLIDAATTLTKTICITEQMIKTHDVFKILMNNPLTKCPRVPFGTDGTDVGFKVQCGGGSSAHAKANFKISKDYFMGSIFMNMGGKNMTVIEHQKGQRIGRCKP